jgi:hypothetical protein
LVKTNKEASMSTFYTWAQIKTKVKQDLDLEDEVFVTDTELMDYCNEAIDEAEAEIHTLYEDYFLNKSAITLVQGTSDYALPSDIYAHKIRRIIYQNGATIYTIDRLKDWKKFEQKAVTDYYPGTNCYSYLILNAAAGTPKISLVPTAQESGAYVTMWYIRNATRMTADASICDIPEFINFIFQYIKVRVYQKEMNPNAQTAVAILQQQRELMQSTLGTMVPDADNTIEMDLSHYEESN